MKVFMILEGPPSFHLSKNCSLFLAILILKSFFLILLLTPNLLLVSFSLLFIFLFFIYCFFSFLKLFFYYRKDIKNIASGTAHASSLRLKVELLAIYVNDVMGGIQDFDTYHFFNKPTLISSYSSYFYLLIFLLLPFHLVFFFFSFLIPLFFFYCYFDLEVDMITSPTTKISSLLKTINNQM